MIDQYIYSRSDGTRDNMMNHIGFGLMYYTDGIIPIQQGISDISYYNSEITNKDNKRVEVISKRQVPRCEGKTAIYLSKMIEPEKERGFLHCHGYVMDTLDKAVLNPDIWFYQSFINYNVNEYEIEISQYDELPKKTTELWPLKTLLDHVDLTIDEFISIVRNCIDAKNNNTVVLIALDFSLTDIKEISAQLIRWIYHFLPFSMRREAGFSTCYDDNSIGGDFTLVLVPLSIIVERGRKISIKARKKPNSASYLHARGQLVHYSSPKKQEFGNSNLIYSRWLESVIRTVYDQENVEARNTIGILKNVYQYFDNLCCTLPEKDKIKEKYLNAACWIYLNSNEYVKNKITDRDNLEEDLEHEPEYVEAMLDFSGSKELEKNISLIFEKSLLACRNGYSEFWVHILCRIGKLKLCPEDVREILTVFLARQLDTVTEDSNWESFEKFRELCVDVYEPKVLNKMMESVFFPECVKAEFYWDNAYVSRSDEDGESRAKCFLEGKLKKFDQIKDVLKCINEWLKVINEFSEEHMGYMIGVLNDVIENVNWRSIFIGIAGLALICIDELNNIQEYPLFQEALEHVYGRIECEVYNKCMKDDEKSLVSYIRDWNVCFNGLSSNKYAVVWWKGTLQEAINKVNHAKNWSSLKTLLTCEQDVFQCACLSVKYAKKIGISEEDCITFFIQNCRYLLKSTDKIVLDRKWYLNFDNESPYLLKELCMKTVDEDMITLSILCDFVKGEDYSYARLCDLIKEKNSSAKVEENCLRVLNDMFEQRNFDELGIDLLEYIYLKKIPKGLSDKQHAEYYEKIIAVKGTNVWLGLLNMYPSAPQGKAEEVNQSEEISASKKIFTGIKSRISFKKTEIEEEQPLYDQRNGKYEWLKTDDSLLYTIHYVIQNKELFDKMLKENELSGMLLIDLINNLAPIGSVLEKKGANLKKEIYGLCRESKEFTNNAQKAMKSLKKNGIL